MRTLLIAGVCVFVLALVSAAAVKPRVMPASEVDSGVMAPDRHDPLPQLVGMTINLYHAADIAPVLDAVARLDAMGFGALQVVTPIFQPDGQSSAVRQIVAPGRGPTREHLRAVLEEAKRRGLRTALMPQVNFTDPRGNEWRGKIQPEDWNAWWRSYQGVIVGFAELAEEADVDLFSVGCELISTEQPRFENQWRELIAAVRERYSGHLTYSTNWDHYAYPPFWDLLDVVGVSGYWDLTRGARADPPTEAELAARWGVIREQLLSFAADVQRPVLLTELGYPSLPWALSKPWDYVATKEVAPDHAAQARGYRSFTGAFGDLFTSDDPRFGGVLFYKWDLHGDADPSADRGYGVKGKPAAEVLRDFLSEQTSP